MKSHLSLLFLVILFAFSCKKDKDLEPNQPVPKDFIIIGDYDGLKTITHDTIIAGGYNKPVKYTIDLNSDGIGDIEFLSEVWGSPAVGQHPSARISCLHSTVFLSGTFKSDTSFINISKDSYIDQYGITYVYIYNTHTCNRISQADSILSINTNTFKLSALNKGDKLSLNSTFSSDTLSLQNDAYSFPPLTIYKPDSIIYKFEVYNNNCSNFPTSDINYIGFRIKDNDKEKFGWIKLCMIDKLRIMILESAIQI